MSREELQTRVTDFISQHDEHFKKTCRDIYIYIFVLDSSMAEDFQDPLLELVIASENTNDPETLLEIAKRAAANSDAGTSSKINLQILEQFTMTKIPMEENVTDTKKHYFIESSDNDFGGNDNLFFFYLI